MRGSADGSDLPKASGSKANAQVSAKVKMPAPKMTAQPDAEGELLVQAEAELHLFDAGQEVFMMQDEMVTASVLDLGNWHCKNSPT